ncbi:uncharacterized protein V6R79_017829 [Siganus canaliculatus]
MAETEPAALHLCLLIVRDPRNTRSRIWTVHHNRLKAYKGTLPTSATDNPAPSAGPGIPFAPPLTALSGALPFRPPTPPHVPTMEERQPLPAAPVSTPPSPHSLSRSPSPSPVASVPVPTPSSPQRPSTVTTRCGRRVQRPQRYGDCVS